MIGKRLIMYAASRLGRKTGRTLIIETKNERKESYWVVGSESWVPKYTILLSYFLCWGLLGILTPDGFIIEILRKPSLVLPSMPSNYH